MAATRTSQSELLRTVYTRYMHRLFNYRQILAQVLMRNSEEYSEGALISVPLHTAGNGAFGWSSSGTYPTALAQKAGRASFNYNRMYGSIRIDGAHIEGAKASYAAERRPYDFETTQLVKQMRAGLNYDLYQDGSGIVGLPTACADGTHITVSDTRGITNNLRVDILNKSTGSAADGVTGAVVDVDPDTGVLTLTSGTIANPSAIDTTPANYAVYRTGSRNDAVYGLGAIISASNPPTGVANYGGIDRTTETYWRAQSLLNGGTPRAISLPLMEEMVDLIDTRSDGETNLIICGHRVWMHVAKLLTDSKRYLGQDMILNGWCKALSFGDIHIVRDKHCPAGKMYFLDTSALEIYQNDEGAWVGSGENSDGAILHRVDGVHAYTANWFRFLQLATGAPNSLGVLGDLLSTIPA